MLNILNSLYKILHSNKWLNKSYKDYYYKKICLATQPYIYFVIKKENTITRNKQNTIQIIYN